MTRSPLKQQSGFVSLFTVVFFMILISVLTLGYIRIMVDEGRQSTDNDLTNTAYHAALAGIEDGKRILKYCSANPGPACTSALSETNCDPGALNPGIIGALGITPDPVDHSVRVANAGDTVHQQDYTCLTVNAETDTVDVTLNANETKLIPLVGVRDFSAVDFSWHRETQEGDPAGYRNDIKLPSQNDWAAVTNVAYPRLQYIEHQATNINLNGLNDLTRTVFLAPTSGAGGNNDFSFNDVDTKIDPLTKKSPEAVACTLTDAYACHTRATLPGPVLAGGSKMAYIRVTALYGKMTFQMKLIDGSGAAVKFKDVQPKIDATGRSNDVFRRVQASVNMNGNPYIPDAAVETGGDFCKTFFVTVDPVNFEEGLCGTLPVPPAPTATAPPSGRPAAAAIDRGPCGNAGQPSCGGASSGYYKYDIGFINRSDNDPDMIDYCVWDWGDGTDSGRLTGSACRQGAYSPVHTYPRANPEPAYPLHCWKMIYTVKFLIYMRDGANGVDQRVIGMPNCYS